MQEDNDKDPNDAFYEEFGDHTFYDDEKPVPIEPKTDRNLVVGGAVSSLALTTALAFKLLSSSPDSELEKKIDVLSGHQSPVPVFTYAVSQTPDGYIRIADPAFFSNFRGAINNGKAQSFVELLVPDDSTQYIWDDRQGHPQLHNLFSVAHSGDILAPVGMRRAYPELIGSLPVSVLPTDSDNSVAYYDPARNTFVLPFIGRSGKVEEWREYGPVIHGGGYTTLGLSGEPKPDSKPRYRPVSIVQGTKTLSTIGDLRMALSGNI